MSPNPFLQLLSQELAPEVSVQQGLRLLESDFRERALLALADWAQAAIPAPAWGSAAPELFAAIAALQRPSWGNWNGLLTALRKARLALLKKGDDDLRQRLEGATRLAHVLAVLDQSVEPAVVRGLQPLSQLVRSPLPGKPRLGQVLAVPIALRNRVAHDMPTDPEWWQQVARALRPLLGVHARPQDGPSPEPASFPEPWFHAEDDQLWAFNGIEKDFTPVFVSRHGKTRHDGGRSQALLLAFQQLLGKTGVQDRDFKDLLARTAPEDMQGVLFGDYLLGRPAGEGGFATVHTGRQLSTGRKVAIKVLRDGLDEGQRRRFQQEAAFLAQLDHANVVKVLGRGEDTWSLPRHVPLAGEEWYERFSHSAPVKSYIALEWIDGETLEAVYQRGAVGRPDVSTLAEWFAQAAEALAAVHAVGLIHRDLKPGNLMVTADGAIKLMDFGIARTQAEARTLYTSTGQILGTPAYMAPEQLRADEAQSEGEPAGDVYGLCATFYELFTGTRLFRHDTRDSAAVLMGKLAGETPEPPRRLAPGLPWEIETLLLGGLEAQPEDRPGSAAELADDLRRLQRNEAIRHKRPPLRRRLQLLYRRRRMPVNLVAGFALVGALATAIFLWSLLDEQSRTAGQKKLTDEQKRLTDEQVKRTAQEAKLKEDANELAETKKAEAKTSDLRKYHRDYIFDMERIPGSWEEAKVGLVQELLEKHRPERTGREDQRGIEWYYWWWLCNKSALHTFDRGAQTLALSPDDALLAVWGGKEPSDKPGGAVVRGVQVLEMSTSREVVTIPERSPVVRLAFSPDGGRLAGACVDWNQERRTTVKVWEIRTGNVAISWPLPKCDAVEGLAFNPDGKLLACSWGADPHANVPATRFDGGVKVWELATGNEKLSKSVYGVGGGLGRFTGNNLCFSEDGKTLTIAQDTTGGGILRMPVRTLNLETGQEVPSRFLNENTWRSKLFDESQKKQPAIWLEQGIHPLALDRKGDRMVIGIDRVKGSIHSYEIAEIFLSNLSYPAQVHGVASLNCLALDHSGFLLAYSSGSSGNGGHVLKVRTGLNGGMDTFRGQKGPITALAYSSDGKRLVSGDHRTVCVWDLTHPQEQFYRQPNFGRINPATSRYTPYVARNANLGASLEENAITLWDVWEGTRLPIQCRIDPPKKPESLRFAMSDAGHFAMSDDGKRLVEIWNGMLQVWDLTTGQSLFTKPVDFSWSPTTAGGSLPLLVLSPDGQRLAVNPHSTPSGKVAKVTVWDTATGQELFRLPESGETECFCKGFSPNGRQVLCVRQLGKSITLTFHDAQTGKQGQALDLGEDGWEREYAPTLTSPIALSPDGKRLATVDKWRRANVLGDLLKVWDLASGKAVEFRGHPDGIGEVRFSPDGKRIAASSGGLTRLWDVELAEEVLVLTDMVQGLTRKPVIIDAIFGPPGQRLVELANSGAPDKPAAPDVPPKGTGEGVVKPAVPKVGADKPEDRFVPLFNGKDLAGWSDLSPGDKDRQANWRVTPEGVLVGSGPRYAGHLVTARKNYINFHLRVEAMLSEGLNSSVDFGGRRVFIGGTDPEALKVTGNIFSDKALLREATDCPTLKPGEWFTLDIAADGNRLTVQVNDKKVNEYVDEKNAPMAGPVVLMCRGNALVRFRKIEIQELPPK